MEKKTRMIFEKGVEKMKKFILILCEIINELADILINCKIRK